MVTAYVLQGYGINADQELIQAFAAVGASAEGLHVGDLIAEPARLSHCRILALPGGFSFGDHLGSGRVMAAMLRGHLLSQLLRFVADGGLMIGICNGFQVLVKMGILPGYEAVQEVSLVHNESGRFVDAWVTIERDPSNGSVWLGSLDTMAAPIRHGEGRFVTDPRTLHRLSMMGQVAFRYKGENPNGSLSDIAGITDTTGRILGLMPHPEAYRYPANHPLWHRGGATEPLGLELFRNAAIFAEGSA